MATLSHTELTPNCANRCSQCYGNLLVGDSICDSAWHAPSVSLGQSCMRECAADAARRLRLLSGRHVWPSAFAPNRYYAFPPSVRLRSGLESQRSNTPKLSLLPHARGNDRCCVDICQQLQHNQVATYKAVMTAFSHLRRTCLQVALCSSATNLPEVVHIGNGRLPF